MAQGSKTTSLPRLGDAEATVRLGSDGALGAYSEIVAALAMPAAVLTPAGLILAANPGLAEGLAAADLSGEPFLAYIARASERSAFGRAFTGLRGRPAGHNFSLELTLVPGRGRAWPCAVRASKLASDNVLLTFTAPERSQTPDVGRALARCLEALDQGLLLLDGAGMIVHANPAARALFAGDVRGRVRPGAEDMSARTLPSEQVAQAGDIVDAGSAAGVASGSPAAARSEATQRGPGVGERAASPAQQRHGTEDMSRRTLPSGQDSEARSGPHLGGRSLLELAEPAVARALSEALTQARVGNWHGEIELRRLDGAPLPVELSLAGGREEGRRRWRCSATSASAGSRTSRTACWPRSTACWCRRRDRTTTSPRPAGRSWTRSGSPAEWCWRAWARAGSGGRCAPAVRRGSRRCRPRAIRRRRGAAVRRWSRSTRRSRRTGVGSATSRVGATRSAWRSAPIPGWPGSSCWRAPGRVTRRRCGCSRCSLRSWRSASRADG
ncbi:PAS domain-containing protein [Nannocystis pusilla]|uniref:PAS domain-containing protein n=1 Tax=Nannocystis pusilla TaxID=889268 RepID=UPI003B7B6AC5